MKLIFHHIPKTAGTSLRRVIDANYAPHEIHAIYGIEADAKPLDDWHRRNYRELGWWQRRRKRIFLGHTASNFIKVLRPPFRCFTVLREPVDQVISSYYHALTLPQHDDMPPIARLVQERNLTLEEIFTDYPRQIEERPAELGELGLFFDVQVRSLLTSWLNGIPIPLRANADPENRELALEAASDMLDQHFVVGFQTCFEESIQRFARDFGWKQLPIDFDNVTPKRPGSSEITDELRELIVQHNQLDIALYEARWKRWADSESKPSD